MSLHKLTAGSGYDYLTRQVAALDATDKGHTGLASYYTEKGERPGVWVGSGMDGIDGLEAGDVVTADQMQALFGSGHHPLANARIKELDRRIGRPGVESPTDAEYLAATRLGAPFKVYQNDVSPFRIEVAKRLTAHNEAAGLPRDWAVPAAERARVRTEVAREFFAAEHGRQPADARELAAVIAKHSRPKTNAVAGYDLTFSPVKSVSVLWAVADQSTAAVIEQAHQAAVQDALDFIEAHALFTRTGANGVRQVNVRGLVATAFTHRDSRAGDPDLHTHVAVANKVQTLDGRWLAIDGRVLFKAAVAASETYNTALEKHLGAGLGVRFAERPNQDARKRPVREIVGVNPALAARWSSRRASIEQRHGELAALFQATHARPPTPVESLQLAQRATLETRQAKHEPRSLAEQRETWHRQAVEVLGGQPALDRMLAEALAPPAGGEVVPDARWVAEAADRVLAAMEQRRSSWQVWHVRAEALRQVRATTVPADQVDPLVELLVAEVLDGRSVRLARPGDAITEPAELRRVDGASVYTVAGADLFTSTRIMEAEQRVVAMAGRRDGQTVDARCVDLALLESAANGVPLNAGQAMLVRQMATSGARVQLAIAPAGSGKTTAMRALAGAWSEGGGTVLGLAPSAAAAAALRDQIEARTDTLAKLTWSLDHGDLPSWADQIGPQTLVVVDEAGMADTLSLDQVIAFVTGRGGSVRLVGDDQQLAAIGAGGVLRDIQASHGALRLTELIRFVDPAEGAASLALREGKPEAIGFYLDRNRVHVGDLATITEDVFASWQADRAQGLDSIMLAPTRELVSELNQRARAHRLEGVDPGAVGTRTRLADGNQASVGELIITRENDRRLRTSRSDWVKNGDRWTVVTIHGQGDLTVKHTQSGRIVRLPSDYVTASTELGYACTVHTAQGVTADTMHGLADGEESRQQLYTMLTRGRVANHLYLQVVGDGDPHSVVRPEIVRPLTPTDLLAGMLARDAAPQSATSQLRALADPTARLGQATQRYLDGLYAAAEHTLGREVGASLDAAVDELLPGLSDEAAWPALRAHLLLVGAHGEDPVAALRAAAGDRELESAEDRAAVLDRRLDASGLRNAGVGPLPWVPGIPARLAGDPHWGRYLTARAELVSALADQVRERALEAPSLPTWAGNGLRPDPATVADVAVWRAAMQVAAGDRRPTGAPQLQKAASTWQRRLNRRVAGDHSPAVREWSHLLHAVAPQLRTDDFTPLLAERLAAMSRAGVDTPSLLQAAAGAGDLPDEYPAAALWWRMSRHLTPAVAAQVGAHDPVATDWTPRLVEVLGQQRAERARSSSWWPALVANLDHGLQRGWRLEDLLAGAGAGGGEDHEECQSLVWWTSITLEPIPDEHHHNYVFDEPPADMRDGWEPPADAAVVVADPWPVPPVADPATAPDADRDLDPRIAAAELDPDPDAGQVLADLTLAALVRGLGAAPLEPTDADIRVMCARAAEWDQTPVSRERMLEVNTLAQAFFGSQFLRGWGRSYLQQRFGVDLAGHEHFHPGQAPTGWDRLVRHLREHGVTDEEMLATGLATTARTGRLVDRFRDRVMLPVMHRGEILGFVGRRHPDLTEEDTAGPKYLNTADTPLFHKGAQLYAAGELLEAGATPVIVEGPMDAIAVTLATAGAYVGSAPLGTTLTDEQAAQLAALGRDPVVATDADLAGRVAAERAFWMLTPHGLDPAYTFFPDGLDPADLLAMRGPAALAGALAESRPLGVHLLTERLDHLPPEQARLAAATVLAARPGQVWNVGVDQISRRLQLSQAQARRDLRDQVKAWDADPRRVARSQLDRVSEVRDRLNAAADQTPAGRWATLAGELDPRLVTQPDWPATAALLQEAHDQGHDITAAARALVDEAPLGDRPARDLRYRLVSRIDLTIDTSEVPGGPTSPTRSGAERERHRHRRDSGAPRRGTPRPRI